MKNHAPNVFNFKGMEFSPNRPHRTVIAIADRGVSLEIDEIDKDFYQSSPDSVEIIADLEKQTPDAVDPRIMAAHEVAHKLWRASRGEALVEHWLEARKLGRFYPIDVLGILGLAMMRHPDLLSATQSLINDVERHRRGTAPAGFAEIESPLTESHFRKILATLRFNYAEDLWQAGSSAKALQNVEASLQELAGTADRWRILDRRLAEVYLHNVLGHETEAHAQKVHEEFKQHEIQAAIEKWAPQMAGIQKVLENRRS